MRYDRLDPLELDAEQLRASTVAVVGAGATGSRMLAQLARLGADLHIVDRDYLEESNLATSALYTAAQVAERLPKAVAAEQRLQAINADIDTAATVADLDHRTVDDLLAPADLVLDGTDNMETRFLIDEYCLNTDTPWVHVAALRQTGTVMPVIPGETACFRCVFGDVDGTGLATCETAGIAPAAAATAASLGVTAAARLLAGVSDPGLRRFDLAADRFERLEVVRREDCPVCQEGRSPHLDGVTGAAATRLCGEDMYQVHLQRDVDLAEQAAALRAAGSVERNDYLLRFENDDVAFTLFRDGRMIVDAASPAEARSVYARFVGN